LLFLGLLSLQTTGCKTTYNSSAVPKEDMAKESTLVFVRPDRYTILGTRSVRDYVEITYEKGTPNAAGLLVVQTGLRNRGGRHWYNLRGPDFAVSVKVRYYKDPVLGTGPQGPPVYETGWQKVMMLRGDTASYESICPVPEGKHYQITVSEMVAK
jgi:hypothetical protein